LDSSESRSHAMLRICPNLLDFHRKGCAFSKSPRLQNWFCHKIRRRVMRFEIKQVMILGSMEHPIVRQIDLFKQPLIYCHVGLSRGSSPK
jgi:hypothetical protein